MKLSVSFKPQTLNVSFNPPHANISTSTQITRDYVDRDPYTGDYVVTPSQETQTLETENKRMTGNVIINPIPSNYGLITWNGAFITVS